MLFRLFVLLGLLSAAPAIAADTYPVGALLGNYQYSQLGANAPSGTIQAAEIYFYDSLLAAPGNAPVSPTTPLPVNCIIGCTGGGAGGSAASFTPNGSFTTPLSVSTTNAAIALPTGTTVAVFNTGNQTAFVNLGSSSIVATASQIAIAPGGAQGFTIGTNTYLAAVTASGNTTLNIAGGAGLFTPYAGSGSGSGGGPITAASGSFVANALADGAIATLGTKADTAWALTGSGSGIAISKEIALELQSVPVTGTFYQATQPISAVALPLPNGAASAANQTAVQSAPGTSAGTAMTMQGSSTGVPVPISASSLPLPPNAAVATLQPALNGDGGSLAHVTNFPSSQAVTLPGNAGALTQATRTCTTTNANIQVANLATTFEEVQNTGTTAVWILFSSGTAQTQAPSYELLPGADKIFSNGPDSYLPTGSWFCISTASDTITLIYK